MTELLVLPPAPLPLLQVDYDGLVAAFFQGRNPQTARAYERDLRAWKEFLGAPTLAEAARLFFSCDEGAANAVLVSYKNQLLSQKLSVSTVNRRLAALGSLIKLAKRVKLCRFDLEIQSLPGEGIRDTRGPGRDGVKRLLAPLFLRKDKKAYRDRALVRLLYDLALRRNEALSLDLCHLDLARGTVKVLGKGRRARQLLTLPETTSAALKDWLLVRGEEPGPLFVALDPASYGQRLSGNGLYWILQQLGKEAGIQVRPHGLRHAAITDALDATGGDVRAVRVFSRHKSIDMLLIYDDQRKDLGGEIARLVAKRT